MPSSRSSRNRGVPVRFLRATLWVLLLPAVLLGGLCFIVGLTFGGALFSPQGAINTILWLAVCSLPFVIGYALNYTAKRPTRLLWLTAWAWLVVGVYGLMTVICSGVLG